LRSYPSSKNLKDKSSRIGKDASSLLSSFSWLLIKMISSLRHLIVSMEFGCSCGIGDIAYGKSASACDNSVIFLTKSLIAFS